MGKRRGHCHSSLDGRIKAVQDDKRAGIAEGNAGGQQGRAEKVRRHASCMQHIAETKHVFVSRCVLSLTYNICHDVSVGARVSYRSAIMGVDGSGAGVRRCVRQGS